MAKTATLLASAASSATIRASINDTRAERHDRAQSRKRVERKPLQNCHVMVTTVNKDNEVDSEKCVDLRNMGTPRWLGNHCTWAACHGMMVEITAASPEQISDYVKAGAEALQQQYAHA